MNTLSWKQVQTELESKVPASSYTASYHAFRTCMHQYGKQFTFRSYHPEKEPEGTTVYMIQGFIDSLMYKLGQSELVLPRGGAVIVLPGNNPEEWMIEFRGFYPKFQNDALEEDEAEEEKGDETNEMTDNRSSGTSTTMTIPSSCDMLSVTVKWSGFLGLGFFVGSTFLLTTKHSIHSDFSKRGTFIWEYVLTTYGIHTKEMYDEVKSRRLTLGMEMLDPEDQSHGYKTREPMIRVTCISQPSEPTDPAALMYWSHHDMKAFCDRYGLPCVESWTVTPLGSVWVKQCLGRLDAHRNVMTFSGLCSLMESISATTIPPPTDASLTDGRPRLPTHVELVGERVEGVLLHFQSSVLGKSLLRIKYKFPGYSLITMVLREYHHVTCSRETIATKVQRWVKGSVQEQTWWTEILYRWITYGQGSIPEFRSVSYIQRGIYTDFVEHRIHYTSDGKWLDLEAMVHDLPCIPTYDEPHVCIVPIVLIVGPIGYGKTTLGKQLEQTIPNSVSIDGDDLLGESAGAGAGTGEEKKRQSTIRPISTDQLGAERNMVAVYRLWEVVMSGKIPIYSTGGNQLIASMTDGSIGKKTTSILLDAVYSMFGWMNQRSEVEGDTSNVLLPQWFPHVVLCLPSFHSDYTFHVLHDLSSSSSSPPSWEETEYMNRWLSWASNHTNGVVQDRISKGIWKIQPSETMKSFQGKIQAVSIRNRMCIPILVPRCIQGGTVLTYPSVSSRILPLSERSSSSSSSILELPSEVTRYIQEFQTKVSSWWSLYSIQDRLSFRVFQERYVVRVRVPMSDTEWIGHITVSYNTAGSIRTLEELQQRQRLKPGTVHGTLYSIVPFSAPVKSGQGPQKKESVKIWKLAIPERMEEPGYHVTVQRGYHDPKWSKDMTLAIRQWKHESVPFSNPLLTLEGYTYHVPESVVEEPCELDILYFVAQF